jgi:pimeloyl-ACP methyl ester carboxylesterase
MHRSPVFRRRWLLVAIGVYVVAGLALMVLEDRLVYHARRASDSWVAPRVGLGVQDVWLRSADHLLVHAWWSPEPDARCAVLFCHGKGANVSHQQHTIEVLRQTLHGFVLVFDYPGFGHSEGQPSEAGCYAATDAAYQWLVQRMPPERIVVFGQSLGGAMAIDLAARQPNAALVLYKTFASLPDVAQHRFPIVPALWLTHNRFDSLAKIGKSRSPVFIAHGDCDQLIPLCQAERLFAAAPAPKQFFVMRGCGHHGDFPPDMLTALAAFVKAALPAN